MTKTIVKDGIEINKNWVTIRRGEVFAARTTTPRDWEYRGGIKRIAAYTAVGGACELCGTKLVWSYALRHKKTNDVLWVGSECIKWYYEAWQPPNGLQMLLEAMKKDTAKAKKEYIAEKLENWSKEYPELYKYLTKTDSYTDIKLTCTVINSETGEKERLPIKTRMFRASLKRKGYLNDEQIAMLKEGITYSSKHAYYSDTAYVPVSKRQSKQERKNVGV